MRLRKALTAGLFINAASLCEEISVKLSDREDTGTGTYKLVRSPAGDAAKAKLRIHPSSILYNCKPQWVCFFSAQQMEGGPDRPRQSFPFHGQPDAGQGAPPVRVRAAEGAGKLAAAAAH